MSTGTKITIAEYQRMIDAGAFEPKEEHHVELIHGEVRKMSPINPPHEVILDRLANWSHKNCSLNQICVRNQNSLGLPELESVPQPDLFWVRDGDYYETHPTAADVFLIIEVADSSLRYDRGEKAELYAEAGIGDYWIANVQDRAIEVYRDPVGKRYRSKETFAIGDMVSPLAFPDIKLTVADLWPK